jgi:hypothetical protein
MMLRQSTTHDELGGEKLDANFPVPRGRLLRR